MLIDIGSRIFDIQSMMAGFIREIMHELGRSSMDIDIELPYMEGDHYRIVRTRAISLDAEDLKLFVTTDVPDLVVVWHEIDVIVQELIANDIHMRYVSDRIMTDLS